MPLLSATAASYGDRYKEHLFDQYKLYVESADRISQRRSGSNSFFLTVNAALVTLYGLTTPLKPVGATAWHYLVPAAGIIVCVAWHALVSSYRNLNSAKFKVIHELETQLPAALYDYEWELLEYGEGKAYMPVSHIEQSIPYVFIFLYAGLILYGFLS